MPPLSTDGASGAMGFSYWQRAERQSDLTCDVAVVGAGLLGASTAFWIKQARPDWQVIVLEAGTVGGSATGRSLGVVRQAPGSDYASMCKQVGRVRARQALRFGIASRAALLAEVRPADMEYEDCGSLCVSAGIGEDRRLKGSISPLRADGLPVAHIPSASVNRRVQGQRFYGGVYVPSDGVLNPLKLVRTLLARSKARVLEHHAVERIQKRSDLSVLTTPNRRIVARQVAVTLHEETCALLGVPSWLHTRHALAVLTAPMERWLMLPLLSHDGQYTLRQLPQGHLMASRWAPPHTSPPANDAPDALQRFMAEHFPLTTALGTSQYWSGSVVATPDGLPVVGHAEALGRCFWAGGLGTGGLGWAFGLGRTLAQRTLTDQPAAEWLPFSAARFER
ncbi:MAG: FAD-binding oxidoreductase [Bacteroidota bacterium]